MTAERMTKEDIEYEIDRIEGEISNLEDEKRELEMALHRSANDEGTIAVGAICEACEDSAYTRFPFCPGCSEKIDRLIEQGFAPSKIAQSNVRLQKCIEVYLARQKAEPQGETQ
jgi:hypothetical protein